MPRPLQPDTISILYQLRETITAVRLAAIRLAVIMELTCPRPPLSAHLGSQTVAAPMVPDTGQSRQMAPFPVMGQRKMNTNLKSRRQLETAQDKEG